MSGADGTITKAELNMLEKMFTSEIEHAISKTTLPYCFQSRSKLLEKLESKKLVERVEFTLNGRFQMVVKGWVLTHSGRFTYCANC